MSNIVDISLREPGHLASWYAVYTRSNFERAVHDELVRKGLESYLPAFTERHRWKDRVKNVELPLFRGYVFVRMEDDDREAVRVLRTTGAVRILGSGSQREPIPDIEIESIRRLLDSKLAFNRHGVVREGDYVRVKSGPLRGSEGRLLRIKNQSRLVLSVEMLSQAVAVEINTQDVEVILTRHRPRLIA